MTLPVDVRVRVQQATLPSLLEVDMIGLSTQRYARAPESHRARAAEAVRAVELYLHQRQLGATTRVATARVQTELGHSPRVVHKWIARIRGTERQDWPALLLPQWVSPAKPDEIHPDAWNWLLSLDLQKSKRAFASSYRRLIEKAKQCPEWGRIPSLRSLKRRYQRQGHGALGSTSADLAQLRAENAALKTLVAILLKESAGA